MPAATADLLEQVDQAVDARGARNHQPQPWIRHSMSASSKGMLWTSWRVHLKLHRCLARHGSVAALYSPPSLQHLRPHKLDHDGRSIFLVVGLGLVVASVLKLGRVGVERHQGLKDMIMHRELNDRSARGPIEPHNSLTGR
jgi:hypothetical protein